jgi:hypothetical protein
MVPRVCVALFLILRLLKDEELGFVLIFILLMLALGLGTGLARGVTFGLGA